MQLRRLVWVISESIIQVSLPVTIYLFLFNFEIDEFPSLLAIRICEINEQSNIWVIKYQEKKNFCLDFDHYWLSANWIRLRLIDLTIKKFKRPSFLSTKEKSPFIYASARPKSACVITWSKQYSACQRWENFLQYNKIILYFASHNLACDCYERYQYKLGAHTFQ
jgi:hypothetical protein